MEEKYLNLKNKSKIKKMHENFLIFIVQFQEINMFLSGKNLTYFNKALVHLYDIIVMIFIVLLQVSMLKRTAKYHIRSKCCNFSLQAFKKMMTYELSYITVK